MKTALTPFCFKNICNCKCKLSMTNINKSTNSFILKNTYIFCLAKHVDISFFIFFFRCQDCHQTLPVPRGWGTMWRVKQPSFGPMPCPPPLVRDIWTARAHILLWLTVWCGVRSKLRGGINKIRGSLC